MSFELKSSDEDEVVPVRALEPLDPDDESELFVGTVVGTVLSAGALPLAAGVAVAVVGDGVSCALAGVRKAMLSAAAVAAASAVRAFMRDPCALLRFVGD